MDERLKELRRQEEMFVSWLEAVKDPLMKVGDWTVAEMTAHFLGWDLTTMAALQQASYIHTPIRTL